MNIFIINFGVIPTIYSLDNISPESYSIIYCKLRLYLLHSALMISRSLIVLACIDRYAVCSTSRYMQLLCKPKTAMYLIILTTISWPIIASHILVLLTIRAGRCNAYGKYSLIYSIYSFIVAGFLPPTFMITFGCLTVCHLRRIHSRIQPSIIRTSKVHRKDYDLAVMLISEIIVYLISTIPYPVQTLYLTLTKDMVKSSSRLEIESFATFMAYSFLIYINSTSTFYVYICTSRAYRGQCQQVITHCWMKIKQFKTVNRPVNKRKYSISRQHQTTAL